MATDTTAVTQLYERIPLEAMQRVADSYMSWYVDRVTGELEKTTGGLRSELRDNDAKEASYRPSPNELGAIERLQRSGVTGTDLLDRMVEQGEDWLMLTMRRLDHFERTGLAPKDYSTWCEHALGGAYDWIDHERLGGANGTAPSAPSGGLRQPAAGQQANVPEWLNNNNRGGRQEESPTAPVPSVRPNWNDSGYYGPNNNNQSGPARPQPAPQQGQQQEDDKGGRNIFRIFTN